MGRVSPAMADAANVADGAGVSAPTPAEEKPPQEEEEKNSKPPAVTPHDTAKPTRNEQPEWLGVAREGGETCRWTMEGSFLAGKGPTMSLMARKGFPCVLPHLCAV